MTTTERQKIESIAYYSRLSEEDIHRAPEFMTDLSATDQIKRAIYVFKASPQFSRFGAKTDYCLKDAADLVGVSYGQLSYKLNEWENN